MRIAPSVTFAFHVLCNICAAPESPSRVRDTADSGDMNAPPSKRARTPREVCDELSIRPDKEDAYRIMELMLARPVEGEITAPSEMTVESASDEDVGPTGTQLRRDDESESTYDGDGADSPVATSESSAAAEPAARTCAIYALRLRDGKYYVGRTAEDRLQTRLEEHFSGHGGCAWTRRHAPVALLHSRTGCTPFDEDAETLRLMDTYGVDEVRGGKYSSTELSTDQREEIEASLRSATDRCFACGGGHFVGRCPERAGAGWEPEHEPCIRCGGAHLLRHCRRTDYVELPPEGNVECTRCGRNNHRFERCIAKRHYDGAVLRDR